MSQTITADLSPCGRYRYTLRRIADGLDATNAGPKVCFICLNPSVADADVRDPTSNRCFEYASIWDYNECVIVNLFAWRSKDPKVVRDMVKNRIRPAGAPAPPSPIGRWNMSHILFEAGSADLVVAAWGAHEWSQARGREVNYQLSRLGIELHALKLSKLGRPCHPLYLKKSLHARPYLMGRPPGPIGFEAVQEEGRFTDV